MSRRRSGPSISEMVEVIERDRRMEREVLQEAQPKPWIVDVAQQHRTNNHTKHRRVK